MKRSIYWKLVLIFLPVILLLDFAILGVAYKSTYDRNMEHCRNDVKQAAEIAAQVFEAYDPMDMEDTSHCNEQFRQLCEALDITYISAYKPNLGNNTITYLAFGFGADASQSAKDYLRVGREVSGLYDEEIEAFSGNTDGVFRYEDNQLDKTLMCYMPVTRHFDQSTHTYVEHETLSIVCAEMKIDDILTTFQSRFSNTLLIVLISTIPIAFLIAFVLRMLVSKPAKIVSRRMKDFVSDRDKEFVPLEVKGNDEFAEMANSFNIMAREIDQYIDDISELNRQKLTQDAELNVARSIQLGLLEPAEFSCGCAEISACMLPAKNVGGDLYDYQVLGDGSIFVAIADVSGKGISASLFMSRAITMLHQYAGSGMSPGEILYQYNNRLADHNPNTMFITTFAAIYHPDTGELVYANAGHNDPYLLSDRLIALDGAHGMAAGIFREQTYQEFSVRLKEGDTIFLYTDGVTEAKNLCNALFGDDALKETLADYIGEPGDVVKEAVLSKVKAFSDQAAQNDDITILAMTILPQGSRRLNLPAKKENLTALNEAIGELAVSEDTKAQLRLIAEEIFVNICSYAYGDKEGEAEILIEPTDDRVTMTFIDSGEPFDPTQELIEIDDYDVDHRIGGLGRFLTFEIADEYSYEYKNAKNILRVMKKQLDSTAGEPRQ